MEQIATIGSNSLDLTQPQNERRKVRQDYRKLLAEVAREGDDIVLTRGRLSEVSKASNEVYKNVKSVVEAALDSELANMTAGLGHRKAEALNQGMHRYEAKEFVSRFRDRFKSNGFYDEMAKKPVLIGNSGPDENGRVAGRLDWNLIGKSVAHLFRRSHGWSTMYGPCETERTVRKVRERRKKDVVAQVSAPNVIDDVNAGEQSELETGKRVQAVSRALRKVYKRRIKAKRDLEFFEFVVDPKSFGRTVENLFHLSFLVKQGFAAVSVADDGRLLLAHAEIGSDAARAAANDSKRPTNQTVFSISMQLWKRIVDEYQITEPLISTRADINADHYLPQARPQQIDHSAIALSQPLKPVKRKQQKKAAAASSAAAADNLDDSDEENSDKVAQPIARKKRLRRSSRRESEL